MKHLDHPIYLVLGEDVQNMPVYKIYSGRVGPDDPWPSPEIAEMWDEPYAVLSYGALDIDYIQFFAGAYSLTTQFSPEGVSTGSSTPPPNSGTPGTLLYGATVGVQDGPWNLNANIPQFYYLYGTLNSVEISLNGILRTAPWVENIDPVPRTMTVGASSVITTQDSTVPITYVTTNEIATTSRSVTAFDGVIDYAGQGAAPGSGFVVDPPIANNNLVTTTIPDTHPQFASFTGAGMTSLSISGTGTPICYGSDVFSFKSDLKMGAELSVVYNYTADASTIQGVVWWDKKQDGIRQAGEFGLAGITVNLYDDFDQFITSTTTDVDGSYYFTGLVVPFGDYKSYIIEVVQPEHAEQTFSTYDGFNTNPGWPNHTFTTVGYQEVVTNIDFGYRGQPEGYYWLCVPMDSGWSPATITRQSDGSTFPMASAADLGVSTEVNGFGYYVQSDIDDVTYRMFRSKTVIYSGDTDTLIVTT